MAPPQLVQHGVPSILELLAGAHAVVAACGGGREAAGADGGVSWGRVEARGGGAGARQAWVAAQYAAACSHSGLLIQASGAERTESNDAFDAQEPTTRRPPPPPRLSTHRACNPPRPPARPRTPPRCRCPTRRSASRRASCALQQRAKGGRRWSAAGRSNRPLAAPCPTLGSRTCRLLLASGRARLLSMLWPHPAVQPPAAQRRCWLDVSAAMVVGASSGRVGVRWVEGGGDGRQTRADILWQRLN